MDSLSESNDIVMTSQCTVVLRKSVVNAAVCDMRRGQILPGVTGIPVVKVGIAFARTWRIFSQ